MDGGKGTSPSGGWMWNQQVGQRRQDNGTTAVGLLVRMRQKEIHKTNKRIRNVIKSFVKMTKKTTNSQTLHSSNCFTCRVRVVCSQMVKAQTDTEMKVNAAASPLVWRETEAHAVLNNTEDRSLVRDDPNVRSAEVNSNPLSVLTASNQ